MTATEQAGRAQRVDTLLRPTEEAFDAKRRWRKAAEEIADEALGFDTKRAWRTDGVTCTSNMLTPPS